MLETESSDELIESKGRPGGLVGSLAFVAYPFVVWGGMTLWGPRGAALALLVVLLPVTILRLRGAAAARLKLLAFAPLLVLTMVALSAVLDRAGLFLAVPTAVNVLLLATFGATLSSDTPMIERFARLQDPDLTEREVEWCRLWTWIWCAFFGINAAIAAVLAASAPIAWWTLYNGLVVYILIGSLFATEWVSRKLKFGRLALRDRVGIAKAEIRATRRIAR